MSTSSFTDVFESLLIENFSKEELQVTESFFQSPVGQKYALHGILQIYAAVGEPLPKSMPELSTSEYRDLEKFSLTKAGDKLIVQKIFESQSTRQVVSSRIRELLATCHAS
ncbi:hypothetical protein AAFN46_20360 [Pseudomonas sp. CAU 1711]|uniref:hypothetical protein n=1 Tax=Pseudomonas sp. CAU 1711 TaxID=3140356 RepID=UPI003260735A